MKVRYQLDRATLGALVLLDEDAVEWERARETHYLLHQRIRYAYPGSVRDLNQRLMVVPRCRHGAQRRLAYDVTTIARRASHREHTDAFGNVVTEIHVPSVRATVEFDAWSVLGVRHPAYVHQSHRTRAWRPFLAPTALTRPDPALAAAAADLARGGPVDLALAERICGWVASVMRYEDGVTTVHTTAADALASGRGVCQDYAHVMLALCRVAGMPARYVSGHLLGEGGSHAWVEVLLPDAEPTRSLAVHPLDPTHNCRTGPRHLTVAVGRDYDDVAPLSGTYVASRPGTLTVEKRAGLAAVDYDT
jgi:transglutaminase-like putative cysteine protease